MEKPILILPSEFDEDSWLWEAKGFYSSAIVNAGGKSYSLKFYDKVRLAQDIEEELDAAACFFENNLVVISSITRAHMEAALVSLAAEKAFQRFTPMP